jgi:hypothetical protein
MTEPENISHLKSLKHNQRSPATLSQVENISTTSKLPASQAIYRRSLMETWPHSKKWGRFDFVKAYGAETSCRQHRGWRLRAPRKPPERVCGTTKTANTCSPSSLPTSPECFGRRLKQRLKLLRQSGVASAPPNFIYLATVNGRETPSRSSSRKFSGAITCGTSG